MGGLSGAGGGGSSAGATEGGGSVAPEAGALGASKDIRGPAAETQLMFTVGVVDEAAAREAW